MDRSMIRRDEKAARSFFTHKRAKEGGQVRTKLSPEYLRKALGPRDDFGARTQCTWRLAGR